MGLYNLVKCSVIVVIFSCGVDWLQAIYSEAIAMVEEYQQAISVSNLGGIRDTGGLYPQLGLRNSPQVFELLLLLLENVGLIYLEETNMRTM